MKTEKIKYKNCLRKLGVRWSAAERFYRDAAGGAPFEISETEQDVRKILVGNGQTTLQDSGLVGETENYLWTALEKRSDFLLGRYFPNLGAEHCQEDARTPAEQLGLDSQWLRLYLLWMVLRVLRNQQNSSRIRALVNPDPSLGYQSRVELRVQLFHHLSRFVRDTLRLEVDGPAKRASIDVASYARSMLFLVHFFVHEHLEVPERFNVFGHLSAFMDQELLLHLGHHYYRDHSFHAVDTFLLGLLLLDLRYQRPEDTKGRATLAQSLIRANGEHANGKEIPTPAQVGQLRRAWAVTSLFHDVGYLLEIPAAWGTTYPFSQVAEWNQLDSALQSAGTQHRRDVNAKIQEDREQLLACLQSCEQASNLFVESTNSNMLDHGVVSAWYLTKLLHQIGEKIEPWKAAVQAVLLHNLRETIQWDSQPLAGLLAFCDEIQEWGRHRIHAADFAPQSVVSAKFDYPVELPLRGRVGAVLLSPVKLFKPQVANQENGTELDDRYLELMDDKEIECVIQYREPEKLRTPTVIIWLSKAWNLQRILTCSRTLTVKLRTEVSEEFQQLKLCYQHLLARVAARHAGKELGGVLRPWVMSNHWRGYNSNGKPLETIKEDKPKSVVHEEVTLRITNDRPAPCLSMDPGPHLGNVLREVEQVVKEQRVAELQCARTNRGSTPDQT